MISIQEAHRVRRRRQDKRLNARCRELIAEGLAMWQRASVDGPLADRGVCRERVHVLGELLAYANQLP